MQPNLLLDRDGHRIVHGDSRLAASYRVALDGQPAALLHADPPYCLLVRRNARGQERSAKGAKIEHEAVTRFEDVGRYRLFTRAWLTPAVDALAPDGHALVWTNFLGRAPIRETAEALGLCFHGEVQWAKLGKQGQGNERLARIYEVALVFGRAPAADLGPADQSPPRALIGGYDPDGEGRTWQDHPNHKAWSVLEPLLRWYSRPGDRVLEPFSGSGSTAAACVRLDRRVSAIERREHWAATSTDRVSAALDASRG
ncbi:MAG: site-specific DNA-methyltransferase [Alphaproteobacteria bacterium]|nr:site-specific DNA-methyltransferase [Alphaproteobacteria bacterium]